MPDIVLGNLKFYWAGNWATTTAYEADDVVKYGPSVYVCLTAHTSASTFAPNSAKWELMVQGVTWENTYSPSTLYQVNDIVGYGGAIYVCIQEGTAQTPSTASSYWNRLVGGLEFEGDWGVGTQYQKGDIVRYGGYTYVAAQDSLGQVPSNISYWDVLNKGLVYIDVFDVSRSYIPGEMVKFGGNLYGCTTTTSPGTLPTNTLFWFEVSEGVDYQGDYNNLVNYKVSQVIRYGGNQYVCIQNTTVGIIPTNSSYWNLYAEGFNFRNEFANATDYNPGDVVRYGARSYVCILNALYSAPTQILPTNATYWAILNKGLDWKGAWSTTTTYKLDDVVEYSGSSYVCITAHADDSSTNTTPNTATTYWQSLAQGDSNAVLTTTGDMIYRNSVGATVRLPVGGPGAYLVVNNGVPAWGVEAPERNFYVSTTGSNSNDGRTIATAWRTIQYAATQTFNNGITKINCLAGTYNELTPIKLGRSVVLEGDGLGAVVISPDSATDKGYGVGISKDGSTPNANSNVFHVNNGARIRNIVFRGFSNGAVCVSLDPGTGPNDTSVWIVSQSPYVQNCTSFTDGGTGMIIDGALHNGGYRSIVANDWTQINSDGFGMIVKNDGRSELVSCFTYYCTIGYLCESGGKIRSVAGNNSYGTYGAVARGYSQLETPLIGYVQLQDDTINSVSTLGSNVHVFTSYRDYNGNTFYVGHTNPTGTDVSSTWSNSSSVPFITKLDPAGGVDWIYTYDSAYGAIHSIVEIDDQIYCGGVIYSGGSNKGFLLKINQSGEIAWQKTVGDTSEIIDLTTDGATYVYAVGNHNTYGATILKFTSAGIVTWSKALDYNDSSVNTLTAQSICYAGTPTTSTDSYAAEGDATAEDDLFIACRDTTANVGMIVRLNTAGGLVTAYNYGNININKLRLDTGNGDGIYMVAVGYHDPAGTATKNPFIMRVTILGNVAWQSQFASSTINGEWKDVIPFGDDIYVSGYMNDATNTYNRGLVGRYSSTGVATWKNFITNSTNNVALNGITLDGVNVIAAGLTQSNSVVFNIQRDLVGNIGTVTSGSWITSSAGGTNATATVAIKNIQNIYSQSPTISFSDTALTLNQSSGLTRSIAATRPGFAGIGNGVNFTVSGVEREPKQGSVIEIYNDDETYFLIGTSGYTPPTITPGNNPNARTLLTANKTFIQDEIIAYINFTYPGFVYNQTLCRRDIGLFVDALDYDLNYATNGETVDGAISYYNSASSLIAITTQLTETVAAFTRFKAVVLDVIQKNAVSRSTGNTATQYIAGTTGEAGAVTLAGSNIDSLISIIQSGEAVAPTKIGYGSLEVAFDPPIPSNKVPTDGTRLVFREAFSQVRMTGHDFLDIGTGGFASTNYPVIIASDYTQAPDQNQETLSETGGRVFYVTTDQDGNFRVGDYFKVEQATGRSTINAQEFNLSGLNELQLGSITAGRQGATVNEFSTDGTMSGNSDTSVPTERAVKTYVDSEIINAIGAATKLKVGTAPNETKVEVTGTGTSTDTIDFSINGTEIAEMSATTLTFKPAGTAVLSVSNTALQHKVSGTTTFEAAQYYVKVPAGGDATRPGTPANGYLRYNTDINAFEGYVNNAWSGIGGGNPWTTKTTTYTAVNNDRLFVNTTSSAITITLPATPSVGDNIRFMDLAGTFGTNNLTVARNGSNIFGLADNLVITNNDAAFQLIYTGATYGWKLAEL
jgi:hypothetical protein